MRFNFETMIERVNISDYALIERSELQLKPGFSVITGETGAGKSILLGALGLSLGMRADSSVVRDSASKCVVEVEYNLTGYGLEDWFKSNDLDFDIHTVVRRQVSSEGKSRSFINDTPVTVKQLKEFGSYIIDIHSQHQSLLLGNRDFQADLLDSFCGNGELLSQYSLLYATRKSLMQQYETLAEECKKGEEERDFLSYRFNMLDGAKLRMGEAAELEQELALLQNSEQVQGALGSLVYELRDGDDNICSRLKSLRGTVERVRDYLSEASEFDERLKSVAIELSDIADEAEHRAESIECNPRRLEAVEERLNQLYDLQMKFRCGSVDDLITERDEINRKIASLNVNSEELEALESRVAECGERLLAIAIKLHDSRVKGRKLLAEKVVELLQGLGIKHPSIEIEVEDNDHFMHNGCDIVRILFAANKNQELHDISDVASGGEISRVMLAFKSILAGCKKLPVVIFDEIDTGVSGNIAHKMAELMHEMSRSMQVIAISHLPQIASVGDWHFKVYKEDSDSETLSKIRLLNSEERVNELAIMMSGSEISSEAKLAAERLLNRGK